MTVFDRDSVKGAEMAALPGISFAEVDVTSEDSVAAGVAHAVEQMGGISAVVHCAGIVTGAKTVQGGARAAVHFSTRFRLPERRACLAAL